MESSYEWKYREIECKIYALDDIKVIGLAKFGDNWIEVLNEDFKKNNIDCFVNNVEQSVDIRLNQVQQDEEDNIIPNVDPINPIDDFEGDDINPFNNGPYWSGTLEYTNEDLDTSSDDEFDYMKSC